MVSWPGLAMTWMMALQRRGEPLVRIQPEHPFRLDMGLGQTALAAETGPGGVDEEAGGTSAAMAGVSS